MNLRIQAATAKRTDGTWAQTSFHCYVDGKVVAKVWITVEFDGDTAFARVNGGPPILVRDNAGEIDGAEDPGAGKA